MSALLLVFAGVLGLLSSVPFFFVIYRSSDSIPIDTWNRSQKFWYYFICFGLGVTSSSLGFVYLENEFMNFLFNFGYLLFINLLAFLVAANERIIPKSYLTTFRR